MRASLSLGAFNDDELDGVLLATNTGTYIFLSHLAVHARFRRQGVGRLLHARLVEEATKLGCKGVITDSWLTATPFYYALGYRLPGAVFLIHPIGQP